MAADDNITPEQLREVEQQYRESAKAAERDRQRRNGVVKSAIAAGWSHGRIAAATELSRGRVGQIATTRSS